MRYQRLVFSLLFLFLYTRAIAQVPLYQGPLEVPADPRSVAMGESFAGLPANPMALMENPAGLAGLTGVNVAYSQRKMNWFEALDDFAYHGSGCSVALPFGVFGVHYNRFSRGTAPVTTSLSPDPVGKISTYEHDVALGFGWELTPGLAAGVEAKYYDLVRSVEWGTAVDPLSTTPAYLVDVGVIYTQTLLPEAAPFHDALGFGLAVQNIGTKLEVRTTAENAGQVLAEELPQYIRIGLSYALSLPPAEPSALVPIAGTFTAEFRSVMSGKSTVGGGRTFWGGGAEITLFEILSFRGGFVTIPFSSVYSVQDRISYRYGTGVHCPLELLGAGAPVVVSANYSAIPLRDTHLDFLGAQRMSLDAFSFEVRWTENL